jgi:hypothetical protein
MGMLRSLLCLSVLLSACAAEAYGCDCAFGGGPVCQDYWKASAVFVGTVIEIKTVKVKWGEVEVPQRLVRFSLDEPFRGVQGAQVEVLTGMGGGDCGIAFVQTQQYLVYASFFEDKLYTGICARTKVVSAAAADLEYMRGLNDAKSGGTVYGEVTIYQRNEKGEDVRRPVSGAKIIIDGPDKRETTTDTRGDYRLDGLPAGDYTAKISLPKTMTGRQTEQKISLANGGCAVVSFWLENDGQLNGRIFNPQGLPVNKAEIRLIESDKEPYRGHSDTAYSDEEGRYAFKEIPPGRYVLSIRFDGMTSQNRPFPATYYPGVRDQTQAKVVTIGEGQRISDYDLLMPPLPLEHEVTGIVVWSNGKPVPAARVEYIVTGDSVGYGTEVEKGNFSFVAYEGLRLTIRASVEAEKGKYVYSDWAQVLVTPALASVKLVLPSP